jgi:hypothetical protein
MNDAQGTVPDRKSHNPRLNGQKRRQKRPAGNDTPIVPMDKANRIAHAQLANMPGCQLSDQAVTLITLRVNTSQSVAALARQLKMNRSNAYNLIASPSGQELIARLARAMLGTAATTAARTLEELCGHKDPHVALQAAQDLMERAGLGQSQRVAATSQASYAFTFSNEAAKQRT